MLGDFQAMRQPVLPIEPQHGALERQIRHRRDQLHDVYRPPVQLVLSHVRGGVPLGGPVEQPGEHIVPVHRPAARHAHPDHLARRGARRVDPHGPSVDDDGLAGRIGEPHGELVGPGLHQGAAAFGAVDHRVVDDLDEVRLEAGERAVDPRRPAHDGLGVLRPRAGHRHGKREQGQPPSTQAHVLAPAGSATRRPIASAMRRTSFIIRSNCSG